MKVHLLEGSLPLYKELIENPPTGLQFSASKLAPAKKYYSLTRDIFLRIVNFAIRTLKLPRMTFVRTDADLIHTNRGIVILNQKPWVLDLDHPVAFVGFNHREWLKDVYRKKVEKFLLSPKCRKIMPWSQACVKALQSSFPENWESLRKKTEVVYPATPVFLINKKPHNKIRLLFTSSLFWHKGGREVLQAFKILRKKYKNVELIVKSDIPEDLKKKYNFPEIKYLPYRENVLPREKLVQELFAQSDIYVYPSYVDIFGLGLLDAMVAGLPIVASDVFAIPEIVEHNKGGLIIRSPLSWVGNDYLSRGIPSEKEIADKDFSEFAQNLANTIGKLIENAELRRKMGAFNRKLVESGKFSIPYRNKKLKRIYEEALNKPN